MPELESGRVPEQNDEKGHAPGEKGSENNSIDENQMLRVEKLLSRLGAVPQDINQRNREVLGQRISWWLNGSWYRVDHAVIEEEPFVLISATDEEKLANIGLMEDIEAIPYAATDEEALETLRQLIFAP